MAKSITLDSIRQNLDFFHKMYDAVRIVDPVEKRVLEHRQNAVGKTGEICYAYWQNGRICDNCISIRAHLENKSFIKLEQNPEVIMMVTAFPVEKTDTPVILELLKNATESMMFGAGDYTEGQLMRSLVSEVNDKVVKDPLTALYNRRFIDERLPADIVRATLEESPLSVIFLDVNNLKSINDLHGHPAGDAALKEMGQAIRRSIRTDRDWAARYGGDEFLICLGKTDFNGAAAVAGRIRRSIEEVSIAAGDASVQFTVSMGIETMHGTNLTAEEIIRLADRKMYMEKKAGKNTAP